VARDAQTIRHVSDNTRRHPAKMCAAILYIEDNPVQQPARGSNCLHSGPNVALYKAPGWRTGLVLAAASKPAAVS